MQQPSAKKQATKAASETPKERIHFVHEQMVPASPPVSENLWQQDATMGLPPAMEQPEPKNGLFKKLFSKSKKPKEQTVQEPALDSDLGPNPFDQEQQFDSYQDVAHDLSQDNSWQDSQEINNAVQGLKAQERGEKKQKKGFLIFKKKPENKQNGKKEMPIEQPEVMPIVNEPLDEVEHLEEQIHKARLALMDFKFDEAKQIYFEIMQTYNTLDSSKQGQVYEDIKDLYYERKNAEKYGTA